MAADLIDYLAEMALLKDIEARDARIAALESKLAASESKCAELEGQIACRNQLRNELATERAARADAERVAVWAVVNGVAYRESGSLQYESWENGTVSIPLHEDTDDAVFSALIEACEGGRDHG
jgi:hypothetical protein